MDAIAQPARVQLDRLEEFTASCLPDTGYVLHDKYGRFEKFHEVEVVFIKKPSRILDEARAGIRAVYLLTRLNPWQGGPPTIMSIFAFQ